MDAVKFFYEKNRMCDSHQENTGCSRCKLSAEKNEKDLACMDFVYHYPEQAVAIVQEWSEKNPEKTILMDLLEKYPNVRFRKEGTPMFCPSSLGYGKTKENKCGYNGTCLECWNRPLSEVKHE